ncbi:post-GPI attachment to proteins factor 2 [Scaptodrosophila lebanonensis]|uniref:Post-GPI attachment to proteins factor 2 n=1 Tax=Drosophila lebanonensis TaxID=7225 RepID=A0A6J2U6V0_DROLE|nr:post-GPI attachment to proteins factor 2 [Scaptodrosophila lebanonensis]
MVGVSGNKVKLLPTDTKDETLASPSLFRISVAHLLLIGFSIPHIALAYFLIMTLLTDFENSNYTHCNVINVIPSISAVAKSQQTSLRVATWLHFPFRLLAIRLYCSYFRRKLARPVRSIGYLAVWFLILETLGSLVLSQTAQIGGEEPVHLLAAGLIWISGCLFMATTFVCYKYYHRDMMEPMEELSFKVKTRLVYTYFCSTLIMWFWYFVHNAVCLPFAYSVFSLCEYVTIWTMMSYTWTCYFDFYHVYLMYSPKMGYFMSEI